MMVRTGTSSFWRAATLMLILSAACSRTHSSPEAADTVTNWLAACERNSDCKGGALCLNALCSLPCSRSSASACAAIDDEASCEVELGMCDLSCKASTSCQVLGPDFSCLAGRCRPTTDEGNASPGDGGANSSEAEQDRSGELVGEAQPLASLPWRPSSIASRNESSFARAARVELSDYLVESGAPRAAWHTDHWQVVWPVQAALMRGTGIGVAAVFPDGRLTTERRETGANHSVRRVYNGPSSTIAHVAGDEQGPCFLGFSDLETDRDSEQRLFDCHLSPLPAVVPVPGSDDWIVAWSTFSQPLNAESADVLKVARSDPSLFGWRTAPWEIAGVGVEAFQTLGLVTSENADLWGWAPSQLGGFDGIYRLPRAARPDWAREPTAAQFDIISGWIHALFPVAGGMRAIQADRRGSTELRLVALDASGDFLFAHALPSIEQVPRDVTYIAEHGLFALCTVEEEVRVHIVDEQGMSVGESVLVDARDVDLLPFGCALAWSGSELLAVWARAEVGAPLSPPPLAIPMGRVQAKIVPLPGLDR